MSLHTRNSSQVIIGNLPGICAFIPSSKNILCLLSYQSSFNNLLNTIPTGHFPLSLFHFLLCFYSLCRDIVFCIHLCVFYSTKLYFFLINLPYLSFICGSIQDHVGFLPQEWEVTVEQWRTKSKSSAFSFKKKIFQNSKWKLRGF